MAPSVATTWKPTRSVACDLAVSRQLQRSVIALLSGGTRIALTSYHLFYPGHRIFKRLIHCLTITDSEWRMASQIWCDISPGIPRSSAWRHLQPFRHRWSAPRPSAGIGVTSRKRLLSTEPTSSGRQACQDVQLSHSIGRDNGAPTIRTCRRRPPGPGRAGTSGRAHPAPTAAATTPRPTGTRMAWIRSVDRRLSAATLQWVLAPSSILLAAL